MNWTVEEIKDLFTINGYSIEQIAVGFGYEKANALNVVSKKPKSGEVWTENFINYDEIAKKVNRDKKKFFDTSEATNYIKSVRVTQKACDINPVKVGDVLVFKKDGYIGVVEYVGKNSILINDMKKKAFDRRLDRVNSRYLTIAAGNINDTDFETLLDNAEEVSLKVNVKAV